MQKLIKFSKIEILNKIQTALSQQPVIGLLITFFYFDEHNKAHLIAVFLSL
jgi:hypothetical protein